MKNIEHLNIPGTPCEIRVWKVYGMREHGWRVHGNRDIRPNRRGDIGLNGEPSNEPKLVSAALLFLFASLSTVRD